MGGQVGVAHAAYVEDAVAVGDERDGPGDLVGIHEGLQHVGQAVGGRGRRGLRPPGVRPARQEAATDRQRQFCLGFHL